MCERILSSAFVLANLFLLSVVAAIGAQPILVSADTQMPRADLSSAATGGLTSAEIAWIRQFGTADTDELTGVAADASGLYVSGFTRGALPGQNSAGVADAFLRKYDVGGNEIWTRQFGSTVNDGTTDVAIDSSGVYVVGVTDGVLPGQTSAGGDDVFVRKYDADGNELWTNQFGSSAIDESLGAAIHGSDFFVAGRTSGMLPGQTSAGGWDAFVTRFVEGPIPLSATADANPNNGPAPLTVSFTGIASGGTPPYAYAWQFGDGGSSTQQDPFHTYQNARTYTATLTVTDSASRPASDSVAITVTPAPNSPPTLDPIESVPAYTIPGQEVRLTASASDPDGDVLTYAWDFGDGGSATGATTAGGGMITATHVYGAARTYSVGLTIDDGRRGTAARSATVRVVAPPAVDMSAQTSSGTVPLTVRFGATPSGGISPYSFRWDFRDGTFSTDQNPIHTYQAAGTYTVTLTVTDAAGFRATRTIPITASPGPSWIPYGFIAVIVAVAIAITAFWRHRRRARSPPAAFPKLGNVIGAEEGRSTSTQGPNEEVKT